jgi:hypothetical protein
MYTHSLRTLFLTLAVLAASATHAAPKGDLMADTWVATDSIGRQTPPYADCPVRPDKTVGMFYFLWQGYHGTSGPYDISKLLSDDPANPKYGDRWVYHWWGEPEAGYYMSRDPWVVRRNMSMLSDAGVDTLIFDVTNGPVYTEAYTLVCETLSEMRGNGQRTPQVMFITWSHSPTVAKQVYDDFYAKNLYPELWFRWRGKPLILGKLDDPMDDGKPLPTSIRDFFAWRTAWFQPAGYQAGYHKWTWGSTSPQDAAWDKPGVPEEVSVSVATHPTGGVGRSYHNGQEPPRDRSKNTGSTPFGLFFGEQWERALKLDPAFVFVTGWNEWTAMRFIVGTSGKQDPNRDDPVPMMCGDPTKPGDSFFVDQYNQEFSRDIEPMQSGHTDNYYYQLVNSIRHYKGARRPNPPGQPKSITVAGPFSQWDSVTPEYRDTVGDTLHRDYAGWGNIRYRNDTGRNDLVLMKVARDAKYVTFYAETKDRLTPQTGHNWMLLFLNSDLDPSTGWHGYDHVINLEGVGAKTTTVKRNVNGKWSWRQVATVSYCVSGNKLMIQVPRSAIGQAGHDVAFDFHWADNIGDTGDISEFFVNGDSAPNRRFNYRYAAHTPGPVWTFETDGFTNGWSAGAGPGDVSATGGALTGRITAGGARVICHAGPSIDTSANPYVIIRMKCFGGKEAALFWAPKGQPLHDVERKRSFAIRADGMWHNYVLDMRKDAAWKGWVNSLRLHPSDAATGTFAIQSIKVRPWRTG